METSFAHRQEIANRIGAARTAAGLSNADLAERVGVNRKTIEKWQTTGEGGAGSIKADRLLALAEALDVSVTWLLAGETAEVA
jgi:transcriptional regulator with XRE-family HTH domain